jgi:hypothetical protein
MLIRNLDPRTAAPVALAPCNRRRHTQRVQRNPAVDCGIRSRLNANDLHAKELDAKELDQERAHVVTVECNARRADRSLESQHARSSDCDWLAFSPPADSVLDLRYRVIQ